MEDCLEELKENDAQVSPEQMADFILDVGLLLMSSGAHCGRVWRNCKRIADQWGFRLNMNLNFTGMFVSVWTDDPARAVTRYKTSPPLKIHFIMLTLVSHLSWQIVNEKLGFDQSRSVFEEIRRTKSYHYLLVTPLIGIASSCLCFLAGGNLVDGIISFVGSCTGYFLRHHIIRLKFNLFLSFIIASFVTSFIVGLDAVYLWGKVPEAALATAVLYLIPGVPLINSVIDLLEGHLSASLSRSLYAASVLTCIAVGVTLSITILGINNF